MTTAAGASGVSELTGKNDQVIVCIIFETCRVVTGMAGDATAGCKSMCRAKADLLVGMT